jgi:hypothetical protein
MADRTQGKSIDYHLGFESARVLFSELTPARIDLLDTLRRMGPSSMDALAKVAGRNYSNKCAYGCGAAVGAGVGGRMGWFLCLLMRSRFGFRWHRLHN